MVLGSYFAIHCWASDDERARERYRRRCDATSCEVQTADLDYLSPTRLQRWTRRPGDRVGSVNVRVESFSPAGRTNAGSGFMGSMSHLDDAPLGTDAATSGRHTKEDRHKHHGQQHGVLDSSRAVFSIQETMN